MIKLKNITKHYGKKEVINNVSLELPQNKLIAFIGSNGAGKSTLILRQSNHLNIRLTVRDLVSFGRYPHSQGKLTEEDEKFIDDSLSYLGLTDLQDSFLDELSGGQRQMAYIAMVIAQDTDYIFLDEPLNNLDMLHSVQIMKVLKRLVNELNKTVMIVIHDINFVSCYADYVIAMKNGQIVQDGNTKDIMNSSVLREIYGMDIDIQNIDGKNICLYYS